MALCEQCSSTAGASPCSCAQDNTAACETLPSQISNFTLQFFGEVVKTEIDGIVSWSLPCSLDVGLPNNPRGANEGLACYFLRLFKDGIIGLTGPTGAAGAAGAPGNPAYSVTLQSFTQPTLNAPQIHIHTSYNPAMLVGLVVFVDASGWYRIDATDGAGTLFVTLLQAIASAPATITAGRLVVPAGYPGASVAGPTGPQGATGATGPTGVSFTSTNGSIYYPGVGSVFTVPTSVWTLVDATNYSYAFTAPAAGTYLVSYHVGVINDNATTAAYVKFHLHNLSNNSDVGGSLLELKGFGNTETQSGSVTALAYADSAGQQIQLHAITDSAGDFTVIPERTTLTWTRVS
jgi:hypothetical protein